MVIIPSGITFVSTPRTGSRAITEALLRKYKDAISSYPKEHHMCPEYIPTDYTIYTVVRNPLYHILSWWAHVDIRASSERRPLQFAKEYSNSTLLPRDAKYRLNIYADIADVFIPYDNRLREVSKRLNLDDINVIGKSTYKVNAIERAELVDYLYENFTADVLLWEEHKLNVESNN